jgi:hypothetical protein
MRTIKHDWTARGGSPGGPAGRGQFTVYGGRLRPRAMSMFRSAFNQGLTLVQFSAQLERLVWDRGCAEGLCSHC